MVSMTPIIVLIVCKVMSAGPEDQNASYTGWKNLKWATELSKMICRRQEVSVVDIDEIKGAKATPFSQMRCQRAAIMLMGQWDQDHTNSSYRSWRVACPVPVKSFGKDGIKGTNDDETIGWHLPACPDRGTVVCEVDSAI